MKKNNEIVKFIKKKLDNIRKDEFLNDIEHYPTYFQKNLIVNKIEEKKETISDSKDDIENYQLYFECIDILDNYNNREQRLIDKIGTYSVESDLDEYQTNLLNNVNSINLTDISCYDITSIAKNLLQNYDANNIVLNDIIECISNKYNGNNLSEKEYIYINGLDYAFQNMIHMNNCRPEIRDRLKEMKKKIDKVVNSYNKVKSSTSGLNYGLIETLIDDEIAFDKTLANHPSMINSRDEAGNPLSYNIMVRYLDSCFLEAQGIKQSLPKDYYLNLYNKIISNPNYNIDDIDKEEFKVLYKYFIKAVSINDSKITKLIEDIDIPISKKN